MAAAYTVSGAQVTLQDLVDALYFAFGDHRSRAAHAKGIMLEGQFVPAPGAHALSNRAPCHARSAACLRRRSSPDVGKVELRLNLSVRRVQDDSAHDVQATVDVNHIARDQSGAIAREGRRRHADIVDRDVLMHGSPRGGILEQLVEVPDT
jgi:hypothetical protein